MSPRFSTRRENRGARADHDSRFAAAHAPPFAGALGISERAVKHGDSFAETRAADAADLKSERDFGNEHDGGTILRERRGDGAQINFGFAAASDAAKKPDCEFAARDPCFHGLRGALLIGD